MGMNSLLLCLLLALPISEVQVVSATAAGFSLSFTLTSPAPAVVFYGADAKNLDQALPLSPRTRFHFAEIENLKPDRDYYFRVAAWDLKQPPDRRPPLKVHTLRAPPGRRLFSFAVMNDIHAGQDINSVMVPPLSFLPPLTPGFTWKYPVDNYWDFTLRATVDGINQTDAAFCVVNGDLSSWYLEKEFRLAKDRLDRLRMPYYVIRGNHDRQGEEPQDWFKVVFGLAETWRAVEPGGCRFLMLDDNNLQNGLASLPAPELDWLQKELDGHPAAPTFIFSHHPWLAGGPDQRPDQRSRFLSLVRQHRQVAGVINAHSHRAAILRMSGGDGPPFIEVPATSEYPVGWGFFEVYEGGWVYSFKGLTCPDCREWDHQTRQAYFGNAPRKMARKLSDRCLSEPFPAGIAPK